MNNTDPKPRSLILVTLAIFLQVLLAALDNTIISTAMPTVVAALGGMRWYSWVFSGYLMASTIATPIAGKLSDQFNRKHIYLASITTFLAASMLCGLAPSMFWLIVWRVVQGLAAGSMFAVSLSLTAILYPPHQRGKIQGMISSLWAIASIIGPALGGYVVEHFSWRWIFYLNLPVGVFALAFILRYLHEPQRRYEKQRIDYLGAALLVVVGVSLLLLITNYERLAPVVRALFAVMLAAFLIVLLQIERRARAPILPIRLLRRKEIAAANLATFSTGMGAFGLILFAPLFVQGALLRPATEAGLVLIPFSIGWASGSLFAGHAVNRLGYRNLSVAGALLMIGGFAFLGALGVGSTVFAVGTGGLIVGLGMGMVTTAITVSVQNNVAQEEIGTATASTIFSRALGAALGTGALGALLAARITSNLKEIFPQNRGDAITEIRALLLSEMRAQLPPELLAQLQQALADAIRTLFLACVAASILALLAAWRVSSHRPQQSIAE